MYRDSVRQSVRLSIRPLLILSLLLLCGCHARCSHWHYMDTINGPAGSFHALLGDSDTLPMQLIRKEDSEPLPGVTVRLVSDNEEMTLKSDSRGVVFFPLSDDLKRANPRIEILSPVESTLQYVAYGSPGRSGGRDIRHVTPEGKEWIESEGLFVFYDEGQETLAEDIMGKLRSHALVVGEVTGLRPINWGILIVPDQAYNDGIIVHGTSMGCRVWPYGEKQLGGDTWTHTNVHEWAEHTLGDRLSSSWSKDCRFVHDGISEYVAYRWTQTYSKGTSGLQSLLDSGTTHVNLPEEFQTMSWKGSIQEAVKDIKRDPMVIMGYSLSFVFWYELSRQYGDDLPKRFLAELSKHETYDAETSIRVLEELTGSSDIRRRLTHADVAEAIEVIKSVKNDSESGTEPVVKARDGVGANAAERTSSADFVR